MSRTVATLAEVNLAKRFLRLIGARATNNQLILAVVAWIRVEGRAFDASRFANRLLAGAKYTPLTFTPLKVPGGLPPEERQAIIDYNEAGQARVDALNAAAKAKADAYKLILAAARHDLAADFLYAIALSSWDTRHYGGYNPADGSIQASQNSLLLTYSRFTGITMPTPPQPAQPKPQPIPEPPTILRPPNLLIVNPDPYAPRKFYDARHRESRLRTLDSVALGE